MKSGNAATSVRALTLLALIVTSGLGCLSVRAAETLEDRKAQIDYQIDLMRKEGELEAVQRARAGSSLQGLPQVISAMTVGGRRTARLQMSSGQVSTFEEGESIAPGIILSSVQPRRVSVAVMTGKRTVEIPLAFSFGAADPTRPPAPLANGPVPAALLPEPPSIPLPPGIPLPSPKASTKASAGQPVAASGK